MESIRANGLLISIHAPREGRDVGRATVERVCVEFQSTRPARGATRARKTRASGKRFQSTRPARGATTMWISPPMPPRISIHAPREGRDLSPRSTSGRSGRISIHAPREGRDEDGTIFDSWNSEFQSTRPARGATVNAAHLTPISSGFQSTRPARGATAECAE